MQHAPGNTDLPSLLRSKGLRATPGRLRTLEVLSTARSPLSAEDLKKKLPKTDLTTVYRTLEHFTRAGITKKVQVLPGFASFELSHGHHHHIACASCGVVEELYFCPAPQKTLFKEALRHSKKFSDITDHSLEFSGLCKQCE